MRNPLLATYLSNRPIVTIGGIISTTHEVTLCSLSSVLESGEVDIRFFLSPRACAGILRRAGKRGKELPPQLAAALQAVVASGQTSIATAG